MIPSPARGIVPVGRRAGAAGGADARLLEAMRERVRAAGATARARDHGVPSAPAVGLIPTIAEAARGFAARRLSPVELTRACLDRIERLEPTLHAFVALDAERALAAARASETRWMRGEAKGPLDGIPIAHKDIIDVAGFRDHRLLAPARRAARQPRPMRRSRRAGARPARCAWASSPPTSSPGAAPPSTCPPRPHETRGIPPTSPPAPRRGRRRRSRRG
ncbi:MAG: amidase family protein [Acetobacteraceae bacterium]|nr:amidase family protein [Acetobacteraceae bacterium]